MTGKPGQDVEPLQKLDGLFRGVASAVGAESPPSVAADLPGGEAAAIDNMLRLVSAVKLTHTLTREGLVVVPARDGSTEVVLESC